MMQPERAFPCINRGAAELHDNNPDRMNRPEWKPTAHNKRTGMGCPVGPAFPLPPRPDGAVTPRRMSRAGSAGKGVVSQDAL